MMTTIEHAVTSKTFNLSLIEEVNTSKEKELDSQLDILSIRLKMRGCVQFSTSRCTIRQQYSCWQ